MALQYDDYSSGILKIGMPFLIKTKNGTENHVIAGFSLGGEILAKNPIRKGRDIEFTRYRCIFSKEVMETLQEREETIRKNQEIALKIYLEEKNKFVAFLDENYPSQSYNSRFYNTLQNATYHKHILKVLLDANNVYYSINTKYSCDTDVFGKVPKMLYEKNGEAIIFTIGLKGIIEIPKFLISDIKKYFNIDFERIFSMKKKSCGVTLDHSFLSRFIRFLD